MQVIVMIYDLREGLNKNINKYGGIFHGGGGGLPIPPKWLILYQKIKTPETDPNALKHEINQLRYFTNCDPPLSNRLPAGYLVEIQYTSIAYSLCLVWNF